MNPIHECIRLLKGAYPNTKISKDTIDAFELLLSGLSHESLMQATVRAVHSGSEFFPSAGEIYRLATETSGGPSPEDAWREVLLATSEVGATGTPEWSHPRVEQAAKILGPWVTYCQSAQVSDRPANRARFLEAYARTKVEADDRRARDAAQALIGSGRLELQ